MKRMKVKSAQPMSVWEMNLAEDVAGQDAHRQALS